MPSAKNSPQTLYDKVFQSHIVDEKPDGSILLYIDRHLVHEVTSPQAFEGLRNAGRKVRRPYQTLATADHNVPTTSRKSMKSISSFIEDEESRLQCLTMEENVKDFAITYFGLDDKRQGIVHVIGPEQGFTLPGTTIVCGDSHTATHGAFGALAFGIGTSEVEHVLATQTLLIRRSKNMRIKVEGPLSIGVSSKDIILHVIGAVGTAGGTGTVIEFCGSAIEGLSMEARMSICNMAIEAGARAGMIAPDNTTIEYLKGRPLAPQGIYWDQARDDWSTLKSDPGAKYDLDVFIDSKDIAPTVTWGNSPQDVVSITGLVPDPDSFQDEERKRSARRALEYQGLVAGTPMQDIAIDKVFIGSCTNSRIEDLRAAAKVAQGRKVATNIKRALVVPGSGLVKEQAELEGLDKVFLDAGFEWREAGCSMCVGMNPDILLPQERCASTSNRNFEGRQGAGGRTHLMSPAMAAAAAIVGKLVDVRAISGGMPNISRVLPRFEIMAEGISSVGSEIKESLGAKEDIFSGQEGVGVGSSRAPFTKLKGIAAPLDRSNVDTDCIIPVPFLKTIKRTGLGSKLFYPLRFHEDGSENPDFVLNREPYRNAQILVVNGPNFGCGSSREHAPWALHDFGITAIIAPSFADIFFNNTFKNGMVPIPLANKSDLDTILDEARAGKEIEIDIINQKISNAEGIRICSFEIDQFRKHCLINRLDDIGLTLKMENLITKYETKQKEDMPWIYGLNLQGNNKKVRPLLLAADPHIGEAEKAKLEW